MESGGRLYRASTASRPSLLIVSCGVESSIVGAVGASAPLRDVWGDGSRAASSALDAARRASESSGAGGGPDKGSGCGGSSAMASGVCCSLVGSRRGDGFGGGVRGLSDVGSSGGGFGSSETLIFDSVGADRVGARALLCQRAASGRSLLTKASPR